ncbi:hypothetical protein JCM16358_23240 [Halanaerocella petrolearia]
MGEEIYGVDISWKDDYELLPAGDVETVAGVNCVIQDIINEFSTPKGSLFYDSEYGIDIWKYLHEENTFINRLGITQEIKKVLKNNARIEPATAKAEVINWDLEKIKLKASFKLISEDNLVNLILEYNQHNLEVEVI